MKTYIRLFILRYLPLFIIVGVISFTSLLTIVLGQYGVYRVAIQSYGGQYNTTILYNTNATTILLIFLPLLAICAIAPLFVNTYRYSIKSVDTYYQVKDGEKTIRYINNLVTIIMIIAIYTASFLICALILLIKQAALNGKVVTDGSMEYHYYMFNFGYYFLAYFIITIIASMLYFISYYFVTRSNNLVNSMISLVVGHGSLVLIFLFLCYYPEVYLSRYNIMYIDSYWAVGVHSPSPISLFVFIFYLFTPLIDSHSSLFIGQNIFSGGYQITMIILSWLTLILVTTYSVLKFIKEDTLSGEYAGKPYSKSPIQKILFHIAFGGVGVWIGPLAMISIMGIGITSFVTILMVTTSFCAAYYVFYSLLNRNFKLVGKGLFQLLQMLPVLSITFLSLFVSIIFGFMWM